MSVRGLHHPSLNVGDLAAAIDFWVALAGAVVVQREDGVAGSAAEAITGYPDVRAKMAVLRVGGSFLEILEYAQPTSARVERDLADLGWSHVCIEVDDVNASAEAFAAAGCSLRSAPVDMGDGIACYLDDPWGNVLELWEIHDPQLRLGEVIAR